MAKRIAIAGTGGVGSNIGALLTRAGYDVTLFDGWPEHIEAMRAEGLHITMLEDDFTIPVKAVHLYELCTLHQQFDTVLLCCKSYDTRWMTELFKPHIAPGGVLVSAQNSLNEEWILPMLGYKGVVGSVVCISAELWDPGHAIRNSPFDHVTDHLTFTVGDPSGRVTPQVLEIAELLGNVGSTGTTTNLWGARWAKLVLNTMDMQIAAITGQTAKEMVQHRGCMRACMVLGKETLAVGEALGYRIEPILGLSEDVFRREPDDLLQQLLDALAKEVRDARGAIWYDLAKGRQTETGYMNGLVAKKGREHGIPTPANDAVNDIVKRLERREISSEMSNLELLEPALQASTNE